MISATSARAKGWREKYLHHETIPFWGVHVMAIVGIALLGWSWTGFGLAMASYAIRMFFVTGAYHRYFSHRTYKTSRPMQFVLALGAVSTVQRGVLWWAGHHRHHHATSDTLEDIHSPYHGGFWWSHVGWILTRDLEDTETDRVKDLARYPELRWLDRHWLLLTVLQATICFAIGGAFALVWVFATAITLCWHGTFTINSLSHLWGGRRYATDDDSRNNPVLALITLGEGWHNNHHHYQRSARQGFYWWEYDITYYVLRLLQAVGLVWDLHGVPEHVRAGTRKAPARPAMAPVAPVADGVAAPDPAI
ncbi:MAG TPA: acyl-CoA desaturase, partial [Kofleriaceae bacterium]|nr:acyl-CoA desaturase [Kofleriaceae bacterium]